jgi:hypothetical protein
MPRISYDLHIGINRIRRGESMNKVTRMLAMTGMAIAATATIGAGAASSAQAAPAKPSADASASKKADFGNRTRVIGYYRNLITCHRIGNLGEWRHRWDDHECYRVRGNFHRGAWVLVAEWDRRGFHGGNDWNNGRDNGFDGRGNGFDDRGNGFDGRGNDWNQKKN